MIADFKLHTKSVKSILHSSPAIWKELSQEDWKQIITSRMLWMIMLSLRTHILEEK